MNASSLNSFTSDSHYSIESLSAAWSGSAAGGTGRAQARRRKPIPAASPQKRPAESSATGGNATSPHLSGPGNGSDRSDEVEAVTELLDDATWAAVENLPEVGRAHAVGRRPTDDRKVLEAVLWVMRHQARWQDLPNGYPSPRTCQRRLRKWQASGTWDAIWRTYIDHLSDAALREWGELFMKVILADAEEQAGRTNAEARIGRPPFWWSMARQFWRWTWDRQSPEQRQRLAGVIDPGAEEAASDA